MPDMIDGRSLWEVVVRMETKLDLALTKLDDHEDRLRNAAPQVDVDSLRSEVRALSIEQTRLANQPFVTPKGLAGALAMTITILLGILGLLDKFVTTL